MMMRLIATTASLAVMTAAVWAAADEVRIGPQAMGDWLQDAPGVRRLIRPQDLPAPKPDQSVANFPKPVPMPAGAVPQVPPGFKATLVVSGIGNPRAMRVAPNGDLFVADSKSDQVLVIRLQKDGSLGKRETFAQGLHRPYGIAFYPPGPDPEWVYVANSNSVVRFKYARESMQAASEAEEVIGKIPETHHWTRDIAFSPDGKRLYLSVGSGSNVALDMFPMPLNEGGLAAWKREKALGAAWDTEERRAQVLSFTPEGEDEKSFATGLRNCAGLTVQPATAALWCVVNERDELGDDTPFEYATEVKEGAFYGWPWFYIGGNADGRPASQRPDLKDQVTMPDVLIQAHSAPLGIAFYDGAAFPGEYRGDAFVTLHGSWNRGKRTGYKVVRLVFGNGKPTGEYEDFMTGFITADGDVWGRPVGIAVAKDGALLVSEDGNGTIWRVSYEAKTQ